MAKDSLVQGAVTVKALERAVSNAVDKVSLARRLREKQQELESFVSVVAHDLKAPLTGVKNNVELLRDFYADKLDANGVQFIEASLRILGRSFALIESLLEYSRIGRSGRPLAPVDLNAVAESVLAGLRGRHRRLRWAGRDRNAAEGSRRRNGARATAAKSRCERPEVPRSGSSRGATCREWAEQALGRLGRRQWRRHPP